MSKFNKPIPFIRSGNSHIRPIKALTLYARTGETLDQAVVRLRSRGWRIPDVISLKFDGKRITKKR